MPTPRDVKVLGLTVPGLDGARATGRLAQGRTTALESIPGKGEVMRCRTADICWAAALGESQVVVVTPPTPKEGDAGMNG